MDMDCKVLDDSQWLDLWKSLAPAARDVYFHPDYAHACARWEHAATLCLRVDAPCGFMLHILLQHPLPALMTRPISGLSTQDSARSASDVQSPYGYGGPIFVGAWTASQKRAAIEAADDLLRGRGASASFIRCHTRLTDCETLAAAGYRVFQVRTNVECDLACEVERSWSGSAPRNLRKALNSGLTWREGAGAGDLEAFVRLYAATAARLDMAPFYRFDQTYSEAIAGVPGTKVVIVEEGGGRAIAAAILFVAQQLAHYHLGAWDFEHQHLRPNDLLYFAMARVAQQQGCERITWGGGMSNDPQDTLFRFKTHFGQIRTPVFCAGKVLDHEKYDAMCAAWQQHNPGRKSAMFLKYRA